MEPQRLIAVPAQTLADVCDLVDTLLGELEEAEVTTPTTSALRGANAELKCHTFEVA